jgi:hypothetical protein
MRYFFALLVFAGCAMADQPRLIVPRQRPSETRLLDVGEVTMVVYPDGQPVGLLVGDGSVNQYLLDNRTMLRVSPIVQAAERDYEVSLGSDAYWTNGLISMFPPGSMDSTVSGVVTVRLVHAQQRIFKATPNASGVDYGLTTRISPDGSYATITGTMRSTAPIPGSAPLDHELYLESISLQVYSDGSLYGSTQDMRGLYAMFRHPSGAGSATNTTDYYPVTVGWYSNNVPEAVSRWWEHAAVGDVRFLGTQTIEDGISGQQRFAWEYGPNGFLRLMHRSSSAQPVLSVESFEQGFYIVRGGSGRVSEVMWTTNGIAGTWKVQTSSSVGSGAVWTNAVILATNPAPAGYMSVTASNVTPGATAFFKVVCDNAVLQAPKIGFGAMIRAPAVELAPGYELYCSNNVLRVRHGVSNGVVNITW